VEYACLNKTPSQWREKGSEKHNFSESFVYSLSQPFANGWLFTVFI